MAAKPNLAAANGEQNSMSISVFSLLLLSGFRFPRLSPPLYTTISFALSLSFSLKIYILDIYTVNAIHVKSGSLESMRKTWHTVPSFINEF